jgi:hypothetical protein
MARFVPDLAEIEAAIAFPTEAAAAEAIARDARDGAAMHELKSGPDAYRPRRVGGAQVVSTDLWKAHLDEWGGAEVRSTPTGALRIAAARNGRFEPS